MSYSLQLRSPSIDSAKQAFIAKFDAEVVAFQPVHAKDRDAVIKNVDAALSLLGERPTHPGSFEYDITLYVNGYLSYTGSIDANDLNVTTASVCATASWSQIISQ